MHPKGFFSGIFLLKLEDGIDKKIVRISELRNYLDLVVAKPLVIYV